MQKRRRILPSARDLHHVDDDVVDVEPIVAPEEAERARLQHVHVVGPGQLDPADLADVAARVGYHHPRGRAVLQLHVAARNSSQFRSL